MTYLESETETQREAAGGLPVLKWNDDVEIRHFHLFCGLIRGYARIGTQHTSQLALDCSEVRHG